MSAATLRHSRCIDSSPSSCVHVATRARRSITNDIYLMHVSTSSHRRLCRQQRGVARTRSAHSGSRWNWWLGTSWKIYRRRELAMRRGVGRVLRTLFGDDFGGPWGSAQGAIWGPKRGVLGGVLVAPKKTAKTPPNGKLHEFTPQKKVARTVYLDHLSRMGELLNTLENVHSGPRGGPPGRPPWDPPGGVLGGSQIGCFGGPRGPPKTSANLRPCVVRTQQAESKADPRRSKSRSSATILTRSRLSVDIGTRCRWSSR